MCSDNLIKYPIIALAFFLNCQSITFAAGTDSTDVSISAGAPSAIYLLTSGYINFGSTPVSNFVINQVCPSGFRPYVTLDLTKVKFVFGEQAITGFGACIMNNNASAASYTIFYQVSRRFTTVRNTAFSGRFVSNSNAVYGLANTVPIPNRMLSFGGNMDHNNVGGFNWYLYCFPLSVALPLNQTNLGATFCNFGDNPF